MLAYMILGTTTAAATIPEANGRLSCINVNDRLWSSRESSPFRIDLWWLSPEERQDLVVGPFALAEQEGEDVVEPVKHKDAIHKN